MMAGFWRSAVVRLFCICLSPWLIPAPRSAFPFMRGGSSVESCQVQRFLSFLALHDGICTHVWDYVFPFCGSKHCYIHRGALDLQGSHLPSGRYLFSLSADLIFAG